MDLAEAVMGTGLGLGPPGPPGPCPPLCGPRCPPFGPLLGIYMPPFIKSQFNE